MKLFVLAPILALTVGTAHAQAKAGDVAAGQQKAAMCIGCHGIVGYQASFPEIHKVPKISGQNAKYLVAALSAYAKEERKHPTMVGIAKSLSDQDMADLAAFYEQHGKSGEASLPTSAAPSAEVAALLQKGICASCHGENFSKPIDPSYPKIAGQHADYLYVALKAYQTGGNNVVGRSNGIMVAQAKPFTHQELKLMASYIASLPGELKTVPQPKFR